MKLDEMKGSSKVIYFEPFAKDIKYRQAVLNGIAFSLKGISTDETVIHEKFSLPVTVHTDGDDVSTVLEYEMNGDAVTKNLDVRDGSLEMFLTYSMTDASKKQLREKIMDANEKVDSDEDLSDLITKVEDLEFAVLAAYTIQRVKVFTSN